MSEHSHDDEAGGFRRTRDREPIEGHAKRVAREVALHARNTGERSKTRKSFNDRFAGYGDLGRRDF